MRTKTEPKNPDEIIMGILILRTTANRKEGNYLFSFPTTIAVGHDQSMSYMDT
jgi:hypothetical protein